MQRRSIFYRWLLTATLMVAVLFGALGQSLARVEAAPKEQSTCYGNTIAQWTFDNPIVGTPIPASSGIGNLTWSSVTLSLISSTTTPPALSVSGWPTASSPDTGKYIQFSISTAGRNSIALTFTSNSSGSGPTLFDLQYNSGSGFVSVDTRNVTTDELNYLYDFSSATDISDKATVTFRFFAYSAGGSTGTWRLDNVTFTGNCLNPGNTPTSTLTPTPSTFGTVIINEVAWMGTLASPSHEWIELYNPGSNDVDISYWQLVTADGSPNVITIPLGKVIPAGGFFLLSNGSVFSADVIIPSNQAYQYNSSSLFSDSGESLILKDPSNTTISSANLDGGSWPAGTLTTANPHGTMERMSIGADIDSNWITSLDSTLWTNHDVAGNRIHGTPGRRNWGYDVINTPTFTPTTSPTASNTPTPTATRTLTPSPTPSQFKSVVITEVAWMGTAASSNDEWIELYNQSKETVDMTGWQIRAFSTINATPKIINFDSSTCVGDCKIAPGQYFLLERVKDDVISDIPADLIYPTVQLNNSGEMLILCTPFNISANNCKPTTPSLNTVAMDVVNQYPQGAGTPTPSPTTTNPWPAGSSSFYGTMERKNLLSSADTNWFTHPAANPRWGEDANGNIINGTPKHPNWAFEVTATPLPTATPTRTRTPVAIAGPVLVLNEFLARPGHDWNGDGQVNTYDEFIEVINAGVVNVNLSGYKLDDYEEDASGKEIRNGYTLPSRTLAPGEIAVFYASETGIMLKDSGNTVRLVKASNYTIVDAYTYPPATSMDISWCRYTDGYGDWVGRCFPTPGLPNALTGSTFPPEPGGGASKVCLLPDTTPVEFVMAECEDSGLDIWNPAYWDSFPGELQEFWLRELLSKWQVIFQ